MTCVMWKLKWQEFLHFAYFDATINFCDNKLMVTAFHRNHSHSWYVSAAARLVEEADDNAHKTFYLDSITCLISVQCNNHRCGGKKEVKENHFDYFKNLFSLQSAIWNLIIPCPFKTTADQGNRSKKWLSNYCDWKSCSRLVQYFPMLSCSSPSLKITKWIH